MIVTLARWLLEPVVLWPINHALKLGRLCYDTKGASVHLCKQANALDTIMWLWQGLPTNI